VRAASPTKTQQKIKNEDLTLEENPPLNLSTLGMEHNQSAINYIKKKIEALVIDQNS